MPDTEMPDGKTVPGKNLAGGAEATGLFHGRRRRSPAGAKKQIRLLLAKGILFVSRAGSTVLPADLPVLFSILHTFYFGLYHDEWIVRGEIIGFLSKCPEREKRS
jgi:hypothetical protein